MTKQDLIQRIIEAYADQKLPNIFSDIYYNDLRDCFAVKSEVNRGSVNMELGVRDLRNAINRGDHNAIIWDQTTVKGLRNLLGLAE